VPDYLPFGQERALGYLLSQTKQTGASLYTSTDGTNYSNQVGFGVYSVYGTAPSLTVVSNMMLELATQYELKKIDTGDQAQQSLFYELNIDSDDGALPTRHITFYQRNFFRLSRNPDGSYSIPESASKVSFDLLTVFNMSVAIPGAQSIEIVGKNAAQNTVYSSTFYPVANSFTLPRQWVASGSNGWAKVVFTNSQVSYYWLATGDKIIPKIDSLAKGPNGGRLLTLKSEPNSWLTLQCSGDLRTWTNVSTVFSGNTAIAIYEDLRIEVLVGGSCFYRFIVAPP
jgi:hypothetical protein